MKRLILLLTVMVGILYFISCRNAENKADQESDSNTERKADDKIGEEHPAPAAKPDSTINSSGSNEILAKIDQHLVSKAVYPAPPGADGIVNATVTIKNTTKVTFQKAIVQVTILGADGKEIKSDFYTIQNVEPGDVETIKIPNESRGASLQVHVVKVKSNELTNGEMVLTGTHYGDGK